MSVAGFLPEEQMNTITLAWAECQSMPEGEGEPVPIVLKAKLWRVTLKMTRRNTRSAPLCSAPHRQDEEAAGDLEDHDFNQQPRLSSTRARSQR